MVVQRGLNEDQILPMARHFHGSGHSLRFIEYMDVGASNGWKLDRVLPAARILEVLRREFELEELEIIKGAMDVERRGYHMYANAAAAVESPKAKELFEHLAAEEQNHYKLLKNTYDFMADPEGFATFEDNVMMDGG